MKKKVLIIIAYLLIVLWMGVIYYFSSMNATNSSKVSDSLVSKTVDTVVKRTNKMGITDYSDSKIATLKENLIHPIRKLAHFTLYFILSLFCLNALLLSGLDKKAFLYSVLICLLYAISDEIHQLFVSGRAGMFTDVLIDTSGGVTSMLFMYLLLKKKLSQK